MAADDEPRRRGAASVRSQTNPDHHGDTLLSELVRFTPAHSPTERPSVRRYRAKCRLCKDVGRIKTPRTIGLSERCPACQAGFDPKARQAELIIDSVIAKRR